jgi:hypothetical protein
MNRLSFDHVSLPNVSCGVRHDPRLADY